MAEMMLNGDLGENESAERTHLLLGLVDAANIGCGIHAGGPEKTRRTIAMAAAEGLRIGAHPGLGDAGGRGTRLPDAPEFRGLLEEQVGDFLEAAGELGAPVAHLKLHGSLYSAVERDDALAETYLEFLRTVPELAVFALAEGRFARRAEAAGLRVVHELFGDRAYLADGSLAPRATPGAVIEDAEVAVERMRRWSETGCMETVDGAPIPLRGQTVCVHGDSPGAGKLLSGLKALKLEAK